MGMLAAPPCDCFTCASARLWDQFDREEKTHDALRLVDHALFIGIMWDWLKFWCVENPPGRLWNKKGTGLRQTEFDNAPTRGQYQPHEFGAKKEETKTTYLWGRFNMPPVKRRKWGPVRYESDKPPGQRDPIARSSSSQKRWRSRTPDGFARAFAEANRLDKEE
jgi:hypothetical protein